MKTIKLENLLKVVWAILLVPTIAYGVPCPDELDPDGDHDRDGIPNEIDPCCFVTSPVDEDSGEMCAFEPGETNWLDQNGNGIHAEDEGACCVNFYGDGVVGGDSENAYCGHADEDEFGEPFCPTEEVLIHCDKLLLYDGMSLESTDIDVSCSPGQCICYTVGDYDHDDNVEEPDAFHPGPFDNCPKTGNAEENDEGEQFNTDGDLWGDMCDYCYDVGDEPIVSPELFETMTPVQWEEAQCTLVPNNCISGYCVPMAFPNPFFENGISLLPPFNNPVVVGNFCSMSPDRDGDEVGDSCDNCLEELNPDQLDDDTDSWGNECDPCPWDSQLGASEEDNVDYVYTDSDRFPDVCDNCPEVTNEEQIDQDGDGAGDLCDVCPQSDQLWEPSADLVNSDGDHVVDECDNCPEVVNSEQKDHDFDEVGDECDPCPYDGDIFDDDGLEDLDMDGFPDICDPCPQKSDIDGSDPDFPQLYPDEDQDGYADICDNCKYDENPEQGDLDEDGIGDVCDTDDGSTDSEDDSDQGVDTEIIHESDTGAVSYSGGGFISCTAAVPSKPTGFSLLSLF